METAYIHKEKSAVEKEDNWYQVKVVNMRQNLQLSKKFPCRLHIHFLNCSFLQRNLLQEKLISILEYA